MLNEKKTIPPYRVIGRDNSTVYTVPASYFNHVTINSYGARQSQAVGIQVGLSPITNCLKWQALVCTEVLILHTPAIHIEPCLPICAIDLWPSDNP